MLRVRLLGRIEVERDGATVPLPVAVRRLFAFLALHPGPHERDRLSARFWPDAAPPAARANLRTAVWAMRKAVGEDAVAATRTWVGLLPEALRVDVVEVATLAERGDVSGAVALCHGELLPELTDGWAAAARDEHRRRYLTLLDRLADGADAAGDVAEAARVTRLRCALTPLDEPAHCALLRRLAAAGDRAGALLAGRELAQRLRAELGVAPDPATRAVLARLRRPDGPAGGSQPGRRTLYGRSDELRTLVSAWTDARDGRGRVMVVTGEAGIGKTRLITELADRADNAGARVAVGAGVDVGGEAPLAVWQELARELVRIVPTPPEGSGWPAELGRLAPDLATALGRAGPPAPVAAPELERLRIFDAVLRLVEWAAAGRPVLLVAEDVHRADRASMALCTHIGRRLRGIPVLFLLTRRDRPVRPEADALLADLAGRGVEVGEIELGPLTDAALGAVARSITALDDEDIRHVVALADGSPLLAVESARALAAGSHAPPPTLRAAVRGALGELPPAARELAEALAVAGRGLASTEIAALGLPRCEQAERSVLDTGLVRRHRGGLRFRHALLAESARADLRDAERRSEQVALAVEAAAGPAGSQVAAEVARHLQRAGRDDLAGHRWRRAAAHARSLGALPEAVEFWTEAIRCTPDDGVPRLELAEVYAWLDRRGDWEREWHAAIERLPAVEQSVAWCRRGLILQTVVCFPTASRAAYERAQELLQPGATIALRARVLVGRAWGEASVGHTAHSTALLEQAAEMLPEPDAATSVQIDITWLLTLIGLGRFAECEAVAERSRPAAERAERAELGYMVWVTTASALACTGDLDGALRMTGSGLAVTRGMPVLMLPLLAARAHVLSRMGRHDEALATVAEQRSMAERLDSPIFAALARHDAGLVALAAGRWPDAADLLGAALDAGASVSRPSARLARAEAFARAGDGPEAVAELRRAVLEPVSAADQPWALVPRMARVQGLAALARGEADEARRRLREARAGWLRRQRPAESGAEYLANLVDLGRPPVVGLVEPVWELDRITAELAEIEPGAGTGDCSPIVEEVPGCLGSR
ncbi:MAG: AAA family ATPase [Pseudonocardia sp.]|nr:AAA family ATPase [Pseudonocardia sp.]